MAKENCVTIFPEVERVTRKLSNEQFGILMRAVIAYRFRGECYEGEDAALDIAFQFLSNQVDRAEEAKAKKTRAAQSRWKENPDAEPVQTDAQLMQNDAEPMHSDAPILSDPVQSVPVQSHPIQSDPVPSEKTSKNSGTSAMGKGVQSAAAPAPAGKRSFGQFGWVKLTVQEYDALADLLGEEELKRCIAYLDESAQTTGNKNRWKDFGLVIRRCSQEGWGLAKNQYSARDVPKGASGVFGEAELRNIRRAMKGGDGIVGTS